MGWGKRYQKGALQSGTCIASKAFLFLKIDMSNEQSTRNYTCISVLAQYYKLHHPTLKTSPNLLTPFTSLSKFPPQLLSVLK